MNSYTGLGIASPSYAVDIVVSNCPGEMRPERLRETPEEEMALALGPNPPSRQKMNWLNPCLAAVYVVANPVNRLMKIGVAENYRNRMAGLNTSGPIELQPVHFVHVLDRMLSRRVEREAHHALDAQRVRGEWFDVTAAEASAAIAGSIVRGRIGYWTEGERRKLGFLAAQVYISQLRRGFC